MKCAGCPGNKEEVVVVGAQWSDLDRGQKLQRKVVYVVHKANMKGRIECQMTERQLIIFFSFSFIYCSSFYYVS